MHKESKICAIAASETNLYENDIENDIENDVLPVAIIVKSNIETMNIECLILDEDTNCNRQKVLYLCICITCGVILPVSVYYSI